MAVRRLHGLTIKAALVLGFSLTLGVWLFTGYDISRRMSALQDEVAGLNARYTRAQDLLSTIRAQVLLGSVYVRDALLAPSPQPPAPPPWPHRRRRLPARLPRLR